MRMAGRQLLAGIVSLVVASAIVTGMVILGSPSDARAKRLDALRVTELLGITTAINYFHSENGRLPATLDELSKQPGVRISMDPATGAPYRYRVLGAEEFELCGTFERASEVREGSGVDVWHHPAGAYCFMKKIEKRATQ